MKTNLILSAIGLAFGFTQFSQAQCTYCYDLKDALKNPLEVVELNLRASGLQSIPSEINQLRNLQKLVLSENLILELDASQIHLPNLSVLDLSYNPGFNGMSLVGLNEAFPLLESLDLEGNKIIYLHGDLSKVSTLQRIDLSHNNLVTIPFEYGKLKLKEIDLSNNQLKETNFIRAIWGIQRIDVSNNQSIDLDQLGEDLLAKENLQYLCFTPNNFRSSIPKSFAEISCNELHIKNGIIDKYSPKWVSNKEINRLTLDNCQITEKEKFLKNVDRMKKLETVKLIQSDERLLDQLKNIDTLILVQVSPSIDYRNNFARHIFISRIGDLPDFTREHTSKAWIDESMARNEVPAIREPEELVQTIQANEPAEMKGEIAALDIPSNAFIGPDGNTYTGKVTLHLTEYKDPITNALSGAPMIYTSEADGTQLFASAGMFEFKANGEKGEELAPNPLAPITVSMSNLKPTQSSKLYSFNLENAQWTELDNLLNSNPMEERQDFVDSLNSLSDLSLANFNEKSVTLSLHFKKKRNEESRIWFSTYKSYFIKKPKKGTLHYENEDQCYLAKQSFLLDTLITDSLVHLFKDMKKAHRKLIHHSKTLFVAVDSPCIIANLKLTPDPENDNYRMTFDFMDQHLDLPVIYNYENRDINHVQNQEKKRWKTYQKKLKKAEKEQEKMNQYKEANYAAQAAVERGRQYALRYGAGSFVSTPEFTFPLQTFGMVNCDYFYRNPPQELIVAASISRDLEGKKIEVPNNVLIVNVDDNFYCSSLRGSIPYLKDRNQIIFFKTNNDEIAVVKRWEKESDGTKTAVVETFAIANKNTKEIGEQLVKIHAQH